MGFILYIHSIFFINETQKHAPRSNLFSSFILQKLSNPTPTQIQLAAVRLGVGGIFAESHSNKESFLDSVSFTFSIKKLTNV